MKQLAFLIGFFLYATLVQGQLKVYDNHFKEPPSLSLPKLDSVRVVRIYETSAGVMNREPIDKPGYLQTQVSFDEGQHIRTYESYNTFGDEVTDLYTFSYGKNNTVKIEHNSTLNPKQYEWTMRDTLISEIKMVKGAKRKLKFRWEYTYQDDTLLTSVVKYDKRDNVKYRMDFEYSDDGRLTRKTIKERGKPARWLMASYDEEGNLMGYRNDDDRQSRYGSQVSIDRDSSDQITAVSVKSRSGTNERWVYEHDEDGKVLKATLFNGAGIEKRQTEYEYDTQGNEVKWTLSEGTTVKQRRDRVYDEEGNLISEHYYRRFMGNLDLRYYLLLTYDGGNRMIRKDYWNKDTSQHMRWDYEYDLF
jgi:hypothetical protein